MPRALSSSSTILLFVLTGHGVLILRRPIIIYWERDPEDPESISTEIRYLGVFLTGPTQAEVHTALAEELTFLWEEYALAPDESLDPEALELAQKLRALFWPIKTRLRFEGPLWTALMYVWFQTIWLFNPSRILHGDAAK